MPEQNVLAIFDYPLAKEHPAQKAYAVMFRKARASKQKTDFKAL